MYYEENEDYDFGISEKESIDIKNYFTSKMINYESLNSFPYR